MSVRTCLLSQHFLGTSNFSLALSESSLIKYNIIDVDQHLVAHNGLHFSPLRLPIIVFATLCQVGINISSGLHTRYNVYLLQQYTCISVYIQCQLRQVSLLLKPVFTIVGFPTVNNDPHPHNVYYFILITSFISSYY